MKNTFILAFIALFFCVSEAKAQSVLHFTYKPDFGLYQQVFTNFDGIEKTGSSAANFFSMAYERKITNRTSLKLGFSATAQTVIFVERLNVPFWNTLNVRSDFSFQVDFENRFYFKDPNYLGEGMYGPYLATNLSYYTINLDLLQTNSGFDSENIEREQAFLRPGLRLGYQIPTFFELDLFAQVNYNVPLNQVSLSGQDVNSTEPVTENFKVINPLSFMLGISLITGW